jgi:calcium/calmodulin-dependent protein kinase I
VAGAAGVGGGDGADLLSKVKADRAISSRYTLGKKLGDGAYATVYEATLIEDNSKWAIKVIDKSKTTPDDMVEVKWEAEALKVVEHENITYLRESIESANYYYLVMEVMSGGELFDRIVEKEHYSEKMARDAIRTICTALLNCHDKGVVHLDMKPENVLYQGPSDMDPLKICDFGISKKCGDGENIAPDENLHGTPGYISPEMIKKESYGRGCDVWAVGCLAYILLAGYPPFDAGDDTEDAEEELFKAIIAGSYFPFEADEGEDECPWDDVSEPAKEFIRQCFTVDQFTRPGFDMLLAHPWLAGDVSDNHLGKSKQKLMKFNARRKLQGAIRKVISANRMKDILGKLREASS